MKTILFSIALLALVLLPAALTGCRPATGTDTPDSAAPHVVAADPVAAGRYLVTVGQCNDCHTADFMEHGASIPEADWLTGSPVGFRGPWGTTYASNLRLLVQALPEDAFVEMVRTRKDRPPMPWVNVNAISEPDVRAIYRYIRSLGPKGDAMPAVVPPGEEPTTPYFDFEPKHLERLAGPAAAPGA